MIRGIGNSLLALVAAVMVADPVMACCLAPATTEDSTNDSLVSTANAQVVTPVSPVDSTPPCHGAKSAALTPAVAEPPQAQPPVSDCPACDTMDCELLLTATAHEPLPHAVTEAQEPDVQVASGSLPVNLLARSWSTAVSTYRPPLLSATTPVSLFQRLLN